MNKIQKLSIISISAILLLSTFFAFQASNLQFDYDFEKFFPQENDRLDFFNKYRAEFENDNDYILFAFVNKEGIFQQDFLKDVSKISQELAELPHVRTVVSPTEATKLEQGRGIAGIRETPYMHIDQQELYKKDSLELRNSQDLVAKLISWESNSISILLKNVEDLNKEESDELSNSIAKLLSNYEFDEFHYLGKITGQKVYIDVLRKEFVFFMSLSAFLLILILVVVYRSVWGVIIPLVTVMFSVIVSLGIMHLAGRPLNIMTILLPVIMLVVGMSDVVHFITKYIEELHKGVPKIEAIKKTLKNVGFATFFTSFTTSIGFLTLITVSIPPVVDFGIFTAIGVLAAFVVTMLFVPAILVLSKTPKINVKHPINRLWDRKLGQLFIFIIRKRKLVYIFYAFVLGFSIWGLYKIEYDYFLMKDLSEDHQLMQSLRFFEEHHGGIRPFELAIIAKKENADVLDYGIMKEMLKIEEYLINEYGVEQLISPTSPFLYANRAMHQNKEEFFRFPEKEKRYSYLLEKLKENDKENRMEMIISSDKKIGRISGRMADPGSKEILSRNEEFDKFFQKNIDTSIIDYKLTGSTIVIDESSRYLSRNILLGLLIAFLIVGGIMGILFKSFKIAIVSLVPNILPLMMMGALIGFIGLDLNMVTSIIFAVGFGIAVDDTIHFLARYRMEIKMKKSNLFALRRTFLSTGRAIFLTTIILLGGFFTLSFSEFQTTAHIGLFVSLILTFALITDLTLLPLLLLKKKKAQ